MTWGQAKNSQTSHQKHKKIHQSLIQIKIQNVCADKDSIKKRERRASNWEIMFTYLTKVFYPEHIKSLLNSTLRKQTGLLWWFSGKESICLPIRETGSIPDPGRSHMLQSNQVCTRVCTSQLLSLCSKAWETQLLSPHAAATEACMPQSLCSTRNTTAVRSPRTITRKQPLLITDREKPTCQQRSSTAKNTLIN